jgi:hypothetical protein
MFGRNDVFVVVVGWWWHVAGGRTSGWHKGDGRTDERARMCDNSREMTHSALGGQDGYRPELLFARYDLQAKASPTPPPGLLLI